MEKKLATSAGIKTPAFVGVDDGRASVKVYAGKGRQFKIRTSVQAGLHAGSAGLTGAATENGAYAADNLTFTVGDKVNGEDTRFEHFDGSTINRVAVHHALVRAGFANQDVRIATGLPINAYYFNGAINESLLKRKREQMMLPIEAIGEHNEGVANITSNIVCSEALSAWLDDVLGEDGQFKDNVDMEHPCGVVDVGGRTTDTLWVNPPDMIDHSKSGSERIGVLDLYDLIENGIREKFDVSELSLQEKETAAIKQVYRHYGQQHIIKDIVAKAQDEICNRIEREIQRRFGNAAALDRILFVGGGAALLPQIASRYKNAILVQDPEFANARGMYKMLKHLEAAK